MKANLNTLTESQILKLEEILQLDKSDFGYYLIPEKFYTRKKEDNEYVHFRVRKKDVCSYTKKGLQRYGESKRGETLFNPSKYQNDLNILWNALILENPNLRLDFIIEDKKTYAQLIDVITNEEVLITKHKYNGRLRAAMVVILMYFGYSEE